MNNKRKKEKESQTTYEITDQVCPDTRNENRKRVLWHARVPGLEARRIRRPCSRSQAIGQGKAICRHVYGQSWSLGLRRFRIRARLVRRREAEVIGHGSEFHSELRVRAWRHGRRDGHHGWCPEDGGYRNGILP